MRILTCEQVSDGHPDKLCDQIADAIVTDCLQNDPASRVAIECLMKDDQLVIAGELFVKNLKVNKVFAMEREIGKKPILAFGNSSGDFAMANAALQNKNYHGEAYMLLCDNTELDYGDVQKAERFAAECDKAGFHTISMRDDFLTIYGDGVRMVPVELEEQQILLPAA